MWAFAASNLRDVALNSQQSEEAAREARRIVQLAWESLPAPNRSLLQSIGASQWDVIDTPLGASANSLLRSAGHRGLNSIQQKELNRALGVWLRELKVVLIACDHPKLDGLDPQSREAFLSRVAWHEWAHALSVVRCTAEDVTNGERFLELSPDGVRKRIRHAGYARRDLTYEVVAESYALLMVRRLAGRKGRPSWLHHAICETPDESNGMERLEATDGYMLGEDQQVADVLAADAELLLSEGISPAWPGFGRAKDENVE